MAERRRDTSGPLLGHRGRPARAKADKAGFLRAYYGATLVADASFPSTSPRTDLLVERVARLPAVLRRQGQRIPEMDLLLAAATPVEELSLVTRNGRHVARIPELTRYQPS